MLEPVQFTGTSIPPDFEPPENSTVARHGAIRVEGSQLVDAHGMPVRLRGMSLFWSQWGSKFWDPDVVDWLVKDWHVTMIRAAMGVEGGGYLESSDLEKQRVATVVDAAIRNGIYVIIDWHDHHAHSRKDTAKEFFAEMAQIYGHFSNVFFEIYNEPLLFDWSNDIKPYEEEVVDTIRNYTDNLVICGTRAWSQDVEVAAEDPVAGRNIAYTLHFYATTHKEFLRAKAEAAMSQGVALFATEWGTCRADGDGILNLQESLIWLDFLEEYNISDANWAVNDKAEACSALLPGSPTDGWQPDGNLTDSGRFVRASLRGELDEWEEAAAANGRKLGSLRAAHRSSGDFNVEADLATVDGALAGCLAAVLLLGVVLALMAGRTAALGSSK